MSQRTSEKRIKESESGTSGEETLPTDTNLSNDDDAADDDYAEEEEELIEPIELKKIWIEDDDFAKNFEHNNGPECVISDINFSDLFRKYQISVFNKAKLEGLEIKADFDEILSLSSILVLRDQPSRQLLQIFGAEKINTLKAEVKKEIKIDILKDDAFNAISNSVRKVFLSRVAAKTSLDSHNKTIPKHIYSIYDDRIENLPDNKKKNLVEDTYTNNDLGPIFRPLFHDVNNHYLYWSNGSSKSSKKRRGALDSTIRGLQPDMRVVDELTQSEILFGEISGPLKANYKLKTAADFVRIGRFLKDSIDDIITRLNPPDISRIKLLGVHVLGYEVRWYLFYIKYDGLYIFYEMAKTKLPATINEISVLQQGLDIMNTTRSMMIGTSDYVRHCYLENEEDANNQNSLLLRETLSSPKLVQILDVLN